MHSTDDRSAPTRDIAQPFLRSIGKVDVFAWNPVRDAQDSVFPRRVDNFGDVLGTDLVYRMAGYDAVHRHEAAGGAREQVLVGLGSVLHLAPKGATIWGTGANFKVPRPLGPHAKSFDVRLVRGPLTARLLQREGATVPAILGEPALLLPRFFPETSKWRSLRIHETLVVPNFNDYEELASQAVEVGADVIDPLAPVEHVLRGIAGARFVVGSSLHAIAVADALGIPARFVRSAHEHGLKYRDYLAGSGRARTRVAPDVASALQMGAHAPHDADLDAIEEAFPIDLWSDGTAIVRRRSRTAPLIVAGWDALLDSSLSEGAEDDAVGTMDGYLARLVAAATATIAGEPEADLSRHASDADFTALFAEASAFRATSGSLVPAERYAKPMRGVLMALDRERPDLARRAAWLAAVGPHALGRVLSRTPRGFTMTVAIRPGEMTNELVGVRVSLLSAEGVRIVREPPFFRMYRQQWSIDIAVVVADPRLVDGSEWTGLVTLAAAGGIETELPLLAGSRETMDLWRCLDISACGAWTGDTPEVSAQTKDG